jgi:hypothetical protein
MRKRQLTGLLRSASPTRGVGCAARSRSTECDRAASAAGTIAFSRASASVGAIATATKRALASPGIGTTTDDRVRPRCDRTGRRRLGLRLTWSRSAPTCAFSPVGSYRSLLPSRASGRADRATGTVLRKRGPRRSFHARENEEDAFSGSTKAQAGRASVRGVSSKWARPPSSGGYETSG